jgi:hypothetical protein
MLEGRVTFGDHDQSVDLAVEAVALKPARIRLEQPEMQDTERRIATRLRPRSRVAVDGESTSTMSVGDASIPRPDTVRRSVTTTRSGWTTSCGVRITSIGALYTRPSWH